jgi:hypothetical protein
MEQVVWGGRCCCKGRGGVWKGVQQDVHTLTPAPDSMVWGVEGGRALWGWA